MIYIDLDNFKPDCAWVSMVYKILIGIDALTTLEEKKDFITKNSIWGSGKSNIKEAMLQYIPNANKCWFSESKEKVSDYHIEHFRPKKAVTKFNKNVLNISFQEKQRSQWTSSQNNADGYWWLAFDYKNYRISGGRINSSFKKNFFPIRLASSFIAEEPNQDYQIEEIILLDPTKKGDPELLTFEANGAAIPTYFHTIDEWKYTRAMISISVYGLNDIDELVKARLKKWTNCNKLIQDTQNLYQIVEKMIVEGIDENNHQAILLFGTTEKTLNSNYQKIKDEINPSSEFSAVARACIRSYNYEWIKMDIFL